MKNVALLGTGFIAGVHMEGWKRISGAKVVAFFEVVSEKAQDFKGKYSIPHYSCLLYTSPSPRDRTRSRMPSSA